MDSEKSYHMINDREEDDVLSPVELLGLKEFTIAVRDQQIASLRNDRDEAYQLNAELQRELDACRAALEPFARMFTWSSIAHGGDNAQVLWRKHWLTGKRMKLIGDHFRLSAVAYYHKGIVPTERKDQATEDAELSEWMAAELERAAKEDTK